MTVHGPEHWARVEKNAKMLARMTAGADWDVCIWFARLHDTMRDNEFADPRHGPRAAELAVALWKETAGGLGDLSREQIDLLHEAIDRHDLGEVSDDPTIGCCWDADRLDLPRVGIEPDPALMSTRMGKTLAAKRQGATLAAIDPDTGRPISGWGIDYDRSRQRNLTKEEG